VKKLFQNNPQLLKGNIGKKKAKQIYALDIKIGKYKNIQK